MDFKILRTYRALGDQWYAVVYFSDLKQQNEIHLSSEKEDPVKKAEALYASLSASMPQNIEKETANQTKIIIDGKIIYSGTSAETLDLSAALKQHFTVSAKVVAK
jgi:hypothetical protein